MAIRDDNGVRVAGGKPQVDTGSVSRTQQSARDQVDLNRIFKRYGSTGQLDHLNPREPHYGDATQALDLATAIELVRSSQADFERLPASVRKACDHNPVVMLQMLETMDGAQLLVDAGMPVEGVKPTVQSVPDGAAEERSESSEADPESD